MIYLASYGNLTWSNSRIVWWNRSLMAWASRLLGASSRWKRSHDKGSWDTLIWPVKNTNKKYLYRIDTSGAMFTVTFFTKSQNTELTQASINGWMINSVLFWCKGMSLLSLEKEGNCDMWDNMDELRGPCAERNKPVTKRQLLKVSIIWSLQSHQIPRDRA